MRPKRAYVHTYASLLPSLSLFIRRTELEAPQVAIRRRDDQRVALLIPPAVINAVANRQLVLQCMILCMIVILIVG